jgi:hypothetical protein
MRYWRKEAKAAIEESRRESPSAAYSAKTQPEGRKLSVDARISTLRERMRPADPSTTVARVRIVPHCSS